MSEKKTLLDQVKTEMEDDESLPLKKGANRLVFGVGDPDTTILFIGEGPGYHEDQSGEPFVGNAGKLLDTLLQSVNLSREKVFITNVVHHRPPENRDPIPSEISAYGAYLDKIIAIIEPQVVLTLGRFSMAKFMPFAKISSVHGKPEVISFAEREMTVIPMYHPAAALRNPEVMRQEKADFLKLPEILAELDKKKAEEQKKVEQMNLI